MTFIEKEEQLLSRIRNGDNNFSEEDYIIIENRPYLVEEIIIAVGKKIMPATQEISDKIFSEYLEYFIFNNDIPNEIFSSACYEFLKIKIDNGLYSATMDQFSEMAGINSEYAQKIKEYTEAKIEDPNSVITSPDMDDDTLNSLLQHKRFDAIKEGFKGRTIANFQNEELIKKIYEEWPYSEKPEVLIGYEKKKGIYNYSTSNSFEELLKDFNNCKKIIIEKIKEQDSINELTGNKNFQIFAYDYFRACDENEKAAFAKLLFDKNYLSFHNYLIEKNIISSSEKDEKFRYCIENYMAIPTGNYEYIKTLCKDEDEFYRYLIGSGDLNYIEYQDGGYSVLQKYESFIIEQVNNDNPKYSNFIENPDMDFKQLPDLFLAVANKGKLRTLFLNNIDYNEKNVDILAKLFEENDLSLAVVFGKTDEIRNAITDKLMEHKKYKSIMYHNLMTAEYMNNNTNLILEILDNLYLANLFISFCYKEAKNNQAIMNKLLSNEILVEKVVNKINHDETAELLYNDETYNTIKNYYIKKLKLNGAHLDAIEAALGPTIIRYITSDEIKAICDLDEETFNKVLGLFPKVEYNLMDLDAAYESLIQFGFRKIMKEDVEIFPNFIHAIEDNNQEMLNALKEKLVIYTKLDFLKEVLDKYQLNNIGDTEELLDLIISKYYSDEGEHYKEILHTLTDEYLRNARYNFKYNHYFEEVNPKFNNYFEQLLDIIDNPTDDYTLSSQINAMSMSLDKKFMSTFSLHNIEEFSDYRTLINYVIEKVRNKETRAKYIPILKEIVDYYYDKQRHKTDPKYSIGEELGLEYNLDEKSSTNEVMRYSITQIDYYYDENGVSLPTVIAGLLSDKGIDKKLIEKCIRYYSNNKTGIVDIALVQKTMPIVIRTVTDYLNTHDVYSIDGNKVKKEAGIFFLNNRFKIKRNYYFDKVPDSYPILMNLNIELLKNGLFKNEELYNKLVDIMKKKKLHAMPEKLKKLIDKCQIPNDYSNIAGFINFFGTILEEERKTLITNKKDPKEALRGLASILINADTYSSVSSVYSQILGDKDSKLLKSNPGPNSATKKVKNNQRLNEAIEYTINNYKRQEVGVPSFDEDVVIYEGTQKEKKINVIVGNFTAPCNLTHGERTGACMRIGGVGESLFDFCLKNKNGFHIRFEDPDTNEYVSRVSGFVNGNTVFLNELRCSCLPDKYEDRDVVEACRKVANRLIELSKDSSCPIENVVIARQYAMLTSGDQPVYLGIKDNKEGLPKFYSDVGSSAVVLATTAKDDKFVPINFDKSNSPVYKPCRSKPKAYTNGQYLIGKINRVAAIKTILSGVNFEDVERMNFENGLLCGVVSDDWYIYVDNNKNIIYDYIDIDERAKVELEEYLEMVDELIKKADAENKEMDSDVYVQPKR